MGEGVGIPTDGKGPVTIHRPDWAARPVSVSVELVGDRGGRCDRRPGRGQRAPEDSVVTGVSTVRVEPDEASDGGHLHQQPVRSTMYPGIRCLIGVGVLGKYAKIWWNALAKHQHWTVPDIEYVLWAILIGLLITNTVGLHRIFRPGVLTYEFWLKVGIVALGSRFVLGDIAKLGATSLVQILVDMTVAGTIILVAARAFGLSGKLGSLLAIGTSICGVSAIVAAKGAIRARNSDVSYAIAAILALGAVALFALPPLGHAIGLTDHEFGLWAGLSVDNTAETTATGYLYSDQAGKIAVLVKSTRNALIGFVVLGFALYWAGARAKPTRSRRAPGPRRRSSGTSSRSSCWVSWRSRRSRPPGWLSKGQTANLANVSKWAFLLTFAGVGTQHRHPSDRPHRVAAAGRRGHRAGRRRTGIAGHGAADVAGIRLGRRRVNPTRSALRARPAAQPTVTHPRRWAPRRCPQGAHVDRGLGRCPCHCDRPT